MWFTPFLVCPVTYHSRNCPTNQAPREKRVEIEQVFVYNERRIEVYTVIQAKKSGDVCALCGREIRPGTVFVIKPVPYQNGQFAWIFAHLWCDAARRGARPVRYSPVKGH